MLPDELEWILEMLGFTWPTADEDKLVQSAEVWEKFASDVTELRATANTSASTVMSNNAGESIDKFKKAYDEFDKGGDGYLQDAAQAATVIGFALRAAAFLVVTCKVAVIVQLIALAIEIAAAAAASIVTFGISNAASVAATAITRVTVRQLLDALKEALIEAVIECMKEPAVSALEAIITDLTRQTVNVGFGAQSGYDLSETVKAGAEGGWEAIKQTPQTFAESVRDSLGSKAGGAARNGAENFADSGPLGSNPSALSAEAGTGPDGTDASNPDADPSTDSGSDSDTGSDGPSVSSTVSADTGGDGTSGPDTGSGPDSARDGNSALDDFMDSGSDSSPGNADNGPGTSSPGGNNSNPGGISSPSPQSGPAPSQAGSSTSSSDGPAIGTQVNSLAATAPTATNLAPPPTTSDPSPSRGDSNHAMPTGPSSPSTGDSGSRNSPSQGGSSHSGGGTPSSPNPGSAPPAGNNPSTTPGSSSPGSPHPGSSSPGGTPPSSNPSPGPSSTPRPTPGDGGTGSGAGNPGGRPSVPHQGGQGVVTPVHTPGGNQPPQHSPGNPGGNPGTPNAPGHQAAPSTPPQAPANNPPQQQAAAVAVAVHTVVTTPAATPQTPDHTSQQPAAAHDNSNAHNKGDTTEAEPAPAASTRDNTPPGGVNDPSRTEQNALDNAVPRDENGDPTRPPDPNDGPWVERINGNGSDSPGRHNNCVDTALSTVDTFAGTPTAAGARTPDPDLDGHPSDRGERGGRDRIENTLGARFNDMGNGRDAYNRLENTLRKSGHGSQAVIITQDANGRAHAWNAVNHNGRITYIDAQSGRRSPNPLHSGNNGVFAVPLGADRRPIPASGDHRPHTGDPAARADRNAPSQNAPDRNAPARPAGSARRPDAEPAGTTPDDNKPDQSDDPHHPKDGTDDATSPGEPTTESGSNKDPDDRPYTDPHDRGTSTTADESRRVTQDGPESDVSRTHEQPEGRDSQEYGIEADSLQQDLREERDVHRVELDRVHASLNRWTESGELAQVLQATAGDSPHPDGPGARRFTQAQLSTSLDGFGQLSRGEQQAVVASVARLSVSFHEQHSVGRSPEGVTRPYRQPNEPDPEPGTRDRGAKNARTSLGVRLHRKFVNGMFKSGELSRLHEDEAKALKKHGPDFSDKNFAVLEVQGPPPEHEISYVVDSSVPASLPGVTPRHSERHLLDWLKRVDPSGTTYTPMGLYTEREPCGEGQGHMKCSTTLQDERFADTPVYYSATYRDDPAGVQERQDMLPAKNAAMDAVDDMTDQEIRDELKRRVHERLVPHSNVLEKNLKAIEALSDEKAQKALRNQVKNEHDRLRDQVETHKERARDAEMTRHMAALEEAWDKLRPQLVN